MQGALWSRVKCLKSQQSNGKLPEYEALHLQSLNSCASFTSTLINKIIVSFKLKCFTWKPSNSSIFTTTNRKHLELKIISFSIKILPSSFSTIWNKILHIRSKFNTFSYNKEPCLKARQTKQLIQKHTNTHSCSANTWRTFSGNQRINGGLSPNI